VISPPGSPHSVEQISLGWERRTAAAQRRAASALRRLAQRWSPDVVHLHSSFAGAVGTIALERRQPTIYTPHAYAFTRGGDGPARRAAYRLIEGAVARRCDLLGAVSHAEAELGRRKLAAPRITVVPNGIRELDAEPPAPKPRPVARPSVVSMGRIGPQRRPEESARILGALGRHVDVRWIGGAPNHEDTPLRAAAVPITGWLDRDSALAHLSAATVLLHWSAWDGQALAILEALARDVVVVASDIPANREIVGASQVCATSAEATALIERLVAEPVLRERCLDEQRRRRHRWSAKRMVSDWIGVYEELGRTAGAGSRRSRHKEYGPRMRTIG
jgi:glycosyltransferase involved in cell wall biosynthesis